MILKGKHKNNTKNTVGKNYIFNLAYQVFSLIVPLVVTPYIARVLGTVGVGQYSFTYSLINYFILMACLGVAIYGQREIAKYQDDKYKRSQTFWEIIIIRIVSTIISTLLCFCLCTFGCFQSYTNLMLWWMIMIVAQAFDITFLFQGLERFDVIVLRNLIIKIISILMIFAFVKTNQHVWIYVLILSLSSLLGNLSLWVKLVNVIEIVKPSELSPLRHLIPSIKLFIPTIAVAIYTLLDRTLIGLLITDTYTVVENGTEIVKRIADLENGYYEQAEKIIKMSTVVVTALGTVMIPRNTNEFAEGRLNEVKANIYFACKYVWMIGIPVTLGVVSIASNMVPWFLGNSFDKSIILMQLFSPLVLCIGLSNVFGLQYLIPSNRDNLYTMSILVGAFTNFLLNVLLIPMLWSIGAVLASVIAELSVTLVMGWHIRKEISIIKILKSSQIYVFAGVIMALIVSFVASYLLATFVSTLLLIALGAGVYIFVLLLMKEEIIIGMLNKLKRRN